MENIFIICLVIIFLFTPIVLASKHNDIQNSVHTWYVHDKKISSKGNLLFVLDGQYTHKGESKNTQKTVVVSESIYKAYAIGDIFDPSDIQFE